MIYERRMIPQLHVDRLSVLIIRKSYFIDEKCFVCLQNSLEDKAAMYSTDL